jgi:hypothetical protein
MVLAEINSVDMKGVEVARVKSELADPSRPLVVRFVPSDANVGNAVQTTGTPSREVIRWV